MNQKQLRKHAKKVKTVNEVTEEIKQHMAKISKLFKPGCQFTFIMRNPSVNDGDIVVSNEQNLKFPIKILKQYKKHFKPGARQ